MLLAGLAVEKGTTDMKFGIFYEHQLPRPWDARQRVPAAPAVARPDRARRPARLPLRVGGRAPLPRGVLALVGARGVPRAPPASARSASASGHGIIQLTTNHPARVAERVSTLDLVSDGRVELGIGEGSTTTELHPFGRRFRDKREVWEDAVRALIPMFGDGGVEYHGTHFDFPLRNVLPKPLQKPHPPLWVACSQRDTIECCRRLGHGRARASSSSAPTRPTRGWPRTTTPTRSGSNRLADYATNPNIAVVCGFMCCPTDEEAHVKADGWTFFAFALRYYATHVPGEPGAINLWEEYQAFRRTPQVEKMHAGGLIGSPETIRTKLRKFEESHVDQVILLNQAGPQHPRGHLREPRAVRRRGHARVRRARRRAPGVEAAGARRRDRARRGRHLARRAARARERRPIETSA